MRNNGIFDGTSESGRSTFFIVFLSIVLVYYYYYLGRAMVVFADGYGAGGRWILLEPAAKHNSVSWKHWHVDAASVGGM